MQVHIASCSGLPRSGSLSELLHGRGVGGLRDLMANLLLYHTSGVLARHVEEPSERSCPC
jgi:hypothetical protein